MDTIVTRKIMKNLVLTLVNRLHKWKSKYSDKRLTFWKNFLIQIINILSGLLLTKNRLKNYKIAKHSLQSLKVSKQSAKALVIGNSPSSIVLMEKEIYQFQNTKKIEVYVMNGFYKSQLSKKIVPDYIVLSDPNDSPSESTSTDLWNWIESIDSLKVLVPSNWRNFNKVRSLSGNRVFFFNDDESVFSKKSINPTRPRSFPSLTALKTLSICCFLKYSEIWIIGVDNSHFEKLKCDKSNNLILEQNHNSENYHISKNLSENTGITMSDYFFDVSTIFKSFELFQKYNIVNLNENSYVDVFRKISHKEIFEKLVTSP